MRYLILLGLDPKLYYTNYFIYVPEQYRAPYGKIVVIRTCLIGICFKIEDI